MPTLEIGGRRVGYVEEGAGDLVIFAHCSLAFAGLWSPCIQHLKDRYHCLSLDLPGHGQSERGDEGISLQNQAVEYVKGAADAFGGGPAHLVGLSLGGAVMGRTAHSYPALARSLTMLEPVFFHLIRDSHPEFSAENTRIMQPVVEACAEGRYHDGARAFMEGWGQPGQFDRFPDAAKDAVARSLVHVAKDFPMAEGWPPGQLSHDDFRGIGVPTLLVEGAGTQAAAKVLLDQIEALMPATERFSVAEAGHLSPVDQPEAVAERLSAFFEAVAGREA